MRIKVNYNHFLMVTQNENRQTVALYKEGDKMPLAGSNFSLSYTKKDLKEWATKHIESTIEHMNDTIRDIIERHDENDIVSALFKWSDDCFINALKDELKNHGYVILKPETIREEVLIEDMVSRIYPTHNEQQSIF